MAGFSLYRTSIAQRARVPIESLSRLAVDPRIHLTLDPANGRAAAKRELRGECSPADVVINFAFSEAGLLFDFFKFEGFFYSYLTPVLRGSDPEWNPPRLLALWVLHSPLKDCPKSASSTFFQTTHFRHPRKVISANFYPQAVSL